MKLSKMYARYNTEEWLMVIWQRSWQLSLWKKSNILIKKKILKYYWCFWTLSAHWQHSNTHTTLKQSSINWSLDSHVSSLFSCHWTFIFTDSSWSLLVSKIFSTWWSFISLTISEKDADTSQLNRFEWYCSRWIIEMTE